MFKKIFARQKLILNCPDISKLFENFENIPIQIDSINGELSLTSKNTTTGRQLRNERSYMLDVYLLRQN